MVSRVGFSTPLRISDVWVYSSKTSESGRRLMRANGGEVWAERRVGVERFCLR